MARQAKVKVKDETKVKKSSKKTTEVKKSAKVEKPVKKVSKIIPVNEKLTRSALLEVLSTTSGIEMKDVRKVFNSMENVILGSICKKGRGEFIWPTLFKIVTKEKAATKERKGISPFTGLECIFKAKPKTTQVKARPLGKLKKAAKGEI